MDKMYSKKDLWMKEIAWAIPPVDKEAIIETVNKYQQREIKGYIVVAVSFYTENEKSQQSFPSMKSACFCWRIIGYDACISM